MELSFGDLSADFFWEILKGRPPLDFSVTVPGPLAFAVVFLAIITFLFLLGLLSRSFYELKVLEGKIKKKKEELSALEVSVEGAKRKYREAKTRLSADEEAKLSPELRKADVSKTHKEEKSRMKYWRMLESEYGRK
ncbi:MAG: hypothetical protein ABH834_04695 [Candidatus Altiarchaeota archaeon]